ncbi:Sodium- and chloride-dependent GABA transporter 1 [Dionaea muscipula]
MGVVSVEAIAVDGEEEGEGEILVSHHPMGSDLDAGALFVLKSEGTWVHCGYHLTTSIVSPALLSLPYSLALLGWVGGISCLIIGALVTFYSYNLISLVLEQHAQMGRRHLRFRDMACDILGRRWAHYFVGPIQFIVCYGAVVGLILLGGECMKIAYDVIWPNGKMKLYKFSIILGAVMLLLAQLPSFHSLRYINLLSLILCLAYSACAAAGSIYIGNTTKETKDYSVDGNVKNRILGAFTAIGIMATTYGNGIIPEIQATLAPPVKGKMFKGLCVCYAVVGATFFTVAVSGYGAFGNQANSFILDNFFDGADPLLPKWFILMTLVFIVIQLSAVAVVYLQPTNEALERLFADPTRAQFSARNVIARLVFRSVSVAISTTIAVMLPFFGDLNALIGAIGFLPLDFVLPAVFFNLTFQPSKKNPIFWLNAVIVVVFSLVTIIAVFATLRQIVLDAKDYHLFSFCAKKLLIQYTQLI